MSDTDRPSPRLTSSRSLHPGGELQNFLRALRTRKSLGRSSASDRSCHTFLGVSSPVKSGDPAAANLGPEERIFAGWLIIQAIESEAFPC